jgi:hypothetical protein
MTGWRLGWMVVPPDLARSVECLAQNFYISPPALSQIAALPVFGCRAELDGHVARYRANRDRLIAMLQQAGLTRFAPAEGAFYLYVDVSALTRDSVEFCRRLLAETGGRGDAGARFRPDPRRQLDPLVLRRLDRGHRRGLLPPRPLAAQRIRKKALTQRTQRTRGGRRRKNRSRRRPGSMWKLVRPSEKWVPASAGTCDNATSATLRGLCVKAFSFQRRVAARAFDQASGSSRKLRTAAYCPGAKRPRRSAVCATSHQVASANRVIPSAARLVSICGKMP